MAEAPVKEVAAMSITPAKESVAAANGSTPKAEAANGSTPTAEATSTSPAPNAGTASFKDQFKLFCKYGDVKSDGKLITLSQSDKWMKQAQVKINVY